MIKFTSLKVRCNENKGVTSGQVTPLFTLTTVIKRKYFLSCVVKPFDYNLNTEAEGTTYT